MPAGKKWLSLDDTAAYLAMGKTALYALARTSQIPAKKVGKKWLFEKQALDAWVRVKQPIESFFLNLGCDIETNGALRDPQREAYLRIYDFFSEG